MEENELISQLQKGNQAAFQVLVENYQSRILNTCYGFVKNRSEAEDLTQEVFIEVYHSISGFKRNSSLATWVYRIAVTKSLNLIRYKKRKKRLGFFAGLLGLDDETKNAPGSIKQHPDAQLENEELVEHLNAAISKLPKSQQIAFTLRNNQGLSYDEIGKVMELSKSSIESLLHRAKKNMQQHLYDYYKTNYIDD